MTYPRHQLAYCSNVHPGATLQAVENNIKQHFARVCRLRELTQMAAGLWLANDTVNELTSNPERLNCFKTFLQQHGVLLTSLNGFPFGNFHSKVVKEQVYLPTWADNERLLYTQKLAEILAVCLPEHHHVGAISTLPFAYASQWGETLQHQAISQLLTLSKYLKALEARSQKRIVVCLEMEPDCVFQATEQLVHFFTQQLLPAANAQGIPAQDVLRYIGCCYDTCHQAVMNEDILASLTNIHQAGIYIGKIQVSNAIKATLSSELDVEALCQQFADEKFLHQSKVFCQQQLVAELADLNAEQLLTIQAQYGDIDVFIHYHIPINQDCFSQPYLASTQGAILTTLDFVKQQLSYQPYLEIETYTWLNLIAPDKQQNFNLHQGLLAEFSWLEQQLARSQLLTV